MKQQKTSALRSSCSTKLQASSLSPTSSSDQKQRSHCYSVSVTDTTSHSALFDLHYLLHVIICGQVLHKIALHLLEASSSLHFIIVFHLVVHLATGVIGRTVNLGLVFFALIDGVRTPDSL